ncbi:MAG: HAMP domain-containing sensor histidine kinase [Oligoflexia bacterium]|nr:HAMP domain-containing sensor histidine kinase [Oligoflexia bacterium]
MNNKVKGLLAGLACSLLISFLFLVICFSFFNSRIYELRKHSYAVMARNLAKDENYPENLLRFREREKARGLCEFPFWIVDKDRKVYISSPSIPLPQEIDPFMQQALSLAPGDYLEAKMGWNFLWPRYVFTRVQDGRDRIVIVRDMGTGPIPRNLIRLSSIVFFFTFLVWIAFGLLALLYIRVKSKARFELLQELAHDIRTPLTSLRTAADTLMIKDCPISEESRGTLLQVVQNESNYLENLIADLFFLSELQVAGASPASVPLDTILEEEVRRSALQGRVEVYLKIDGAQEHPVMIPNEVLFRRLFSNVLANAVHAARERVDVSSRVDERRILITIVDDGPGMSGEQIRDFGIKRKIRDFRGRDFKGSLGLGSVIIRTLVSHLNGKLRVANRVDRSGLEVSIEFPV